MKRNAALAPSEHGLRSWTALVLLLAIFSGWVGCGVEKESPNAEARDNSVNIVLNSVDVRNYHQGFLRQVVRAHEVVLDLEKETVRASGGIYVQVFSEKALEIRR